LLPHLEQLDLKDLKQDKPFRLPVQYVIRPLSNEYHDYRGYAGTIASGSVEVGQEIAVIPSGTTTTVTAIESPQGDVSSASEAEAVTIRIADNLDISRGTMMSDASDRPKTDNTLDVTICWMGERTPLKVGMTLKIKHNTHTARVMVNALQCRFDINKLSVRESCKELNLNQIGQVTLRTSEPLVFDEYAKCRGTGSFILIDESTNETVGAGMIGRPPFLGQLGV
jgi:bifunctional enzyme CysN/CysC